MAIRKVAVMGNPILRRKAEQVPPDQISSPRIQALIDDMIETQREYGGIGLAAPQVHEPLAIVALGLDNPPTDDGEDSSYFPRMVLINPKITEFSTQMEADWEGCLSVPDLSGMVKRSVAVTVEGLDRHGNPVKVAAEGWMARVFQHEIDHLHGLLYIDRMGDLKTLSFNRELSRRGVETPAE